MANLGMILSVRQVFQLQDLWTAGLGCDLGGAILLARGLVGHPSQLSRNAGTFFGSGPYQVIGAARDRIDAITGLTGLGAGFVLQATGYIAGLSTPHMTKTGSREAMVGAGFGALTLILVLAAGWLHRRLRLTPTVVEMAKYTFDGTRLEYPQATLLPDWLRALKYEQRHGEDDLAFVSGAVGVKNLIVEDVDTIGSRRRLWTDPPLPPRPPPPITPPS